MTYAAIGAAAALVAWLVYVPRCTRALLARLGMRRANFRGTEVPTAYGALILLWAVPALAAAATVSAERRASALAWLLIVGGMGLLGFVDDRWGDRAVKGLRGHVLALVHDRRLTTGLVKAVGGLLLAAAGLVWTEAPRWPEAAAGAVVVALSANAWNLLDLRPGRACAAFLFVSAALLSAQLPTDPLPMLLLVAIPAAVAYPADARALAMLGDTGSNALGAAAGLALVQTVDTLAGRLVVLGLLVALHVVAERRSLTAIIDASPALSRLDRLTGKR